MSVLGMIMIEFFKYSNTEGKIIFLWVMFTSLCLIAGIFKLCFLIAGVFSLVTGFFSCLIILPDAQFGREDPADENALF